MEKIKGRLLSWLPSAEHRRHATARFQFVLKGWTSTLLPASTVHFLGENPAELQVVAAVTRRQVALDLGRPREGAIPETRFSIPQPIIFKNDEKTGEGLLYSSSISRVQGGGVGVCRGGGGCTGSWRRPARGHGTRGHGYWLGVWGPLGGRKEGRKEARKARESRAGWRSWTWSLPSPCVGEPSGQGGGRARAGGRPASLGRQPPEAEAFFSWGFSWPALLF